MAARAASSSTSAQAYAGKSNRSPGGLELPDCEALAPNGKTYIYVLDLRDPRQMELLIKE